MIAAIVLAAGGSRRFGRANKLLEPVGGRPLLVRALAAAAPCGSLIVVTGADRARVRRVVAAHAPTRTRIVHAPSWQSGLAASLTAGLAALRPIERWVVVLPGDLPGVTVGLVRRVIRARRPGIDLVRVVHRGRPGHPLLVRRSVATALALAGDRGLIQSLGRLAAARVREIEAGAGATRDIDRVADLRRFRRTAAREKSRPR